MLDLKRSMALYSVCWIILKISFTGHLPFRLWHQEPGAYYMTYVIIKGDLFGNKQYVETFLKLFFPPAGPCFSVHQLRTPRLQGHNNGKHVHSAACCVPDTFPELSTYIHDLSSYNNPMSKSINFLLPS